MLRCQELLNRIQRIFTKMFSNAIQIIRNSPALIYQLLPTKEPMHNECLQIYVNTFSGEIRCKIGISTSAENSQLEELEKQLNNDLHLNVAIFKKCIQNLQIQLFTERYKKALDEERMRIIKTQQFPNQQKLEELSKNLLCIQLVLEQRIYLVSFLQD